MSKPLLEALTSHCWEAAGPTAACFGIPAPKPSRLPSLCGCMAWPPNVTLSQSGLNGAVKGSLRDMAVAEKTIGSCFAFGAHGVLQLNPSWPMITSGSSSGSAARRCGRRTSMKLSGLRPWCHWTFACSAPSPPCRLTMVGGRKRTGLPLSVPTLAWLASSSSFFVVLSATTTVCVRSWYLHPQHGVGFRCVTHHVRLAQPSSPVAGAANARCVICPAVSKWTFTCSSVENVWLVPSLKRTVWPYGSAPVISCQLRPSRLKKWVESALRAQCVTSAVLYAWPMMCQLPRRSIHICAWASTTPSGGATRDSGLGRSQMDPRESRQEERWHGRCCPRQSTSRLPRCAASSTPFAYPAPSEKTLRRGRLELAARSRTRETRARGVSWGLSGRSV